MTPLVLLIGFLGSGKTTFLKNLMPALAVEGLTPQLIINDYQNARIDAEQFSDLAAEVKALSGDCVCCGSRDELLAMLRECSHGDGRVVIVETNGTTDSAQLIESLALDPSLKKFTPPLQVSLIDGKRWQRRFWHNALERAQARTASHIHISHGDEISPSRMEAVIESLRECGVRGKTTDCAAFATELARISESVGEMSGAVLNSCTDFVPPVAPSHGHDAHHFVSCEIPLPRTIGRAEFDALMEDLPEEVLRAKGLVVFDDSPGEFFVFQKVGRDDETRFYPVGREPRVKTPLLLLIGPGLSVDSLRGRVASLAPAG